MPFTWGFPGNPYFQMTTQLYVGSAAGPWHAFLCANIADTATGGWLEICDEPWNSTGSYEWTHITCTTTPGFALLWQRAGTNSAYMNAYGSDTNATGKTINVNWTQTREQFTNLITAAHNQCGTPTDGYSMDNWKLYYSEDGIEEIGAAGYGAGLTFQESNESMATNY
jgi:hypothetical protein